MGEENAKGWCFCDWFLEFLSLSLSLPDFYSLSHLPPPLFSSLSLSHCFSVVLLSPLLSPPHVHPPLSLSNNPPTHQPTKPIPSQHPHLSPPSFSLPSLLPPPVLETRKTNAANRTLCESRQENETGIKTRTTRTATLKSALGYFKLKITARFQTAPGKNLQPNESPTQRHSRSCRTRKQEKVRERWNDEGR